MEIDSNSQIIPKKTPLQWLVFLCFFDRVEAKRGEPMKSFKDVLYDKSDILVAVLILLAAVAVIINRVDAIMEYPQTLGSL